MLVIDVKFCDVPINVMTMNCYEFKVKLLCQHVGW